MARIRSIHPGFFTDEDVVEASIAARLLLIGLGVEADDKGVFPWKEKTLKMRIFPADVIEIAPLMQELADLGLIRSYEFAERSYGAIRNFRKHQRPKSPNDVHPCPQEMLQFVGLGGISFSNEGQQKQGVSEMDTSNEAPFPQSGEIAEQMEDGGWRMDILSKDKIVDFDDFWKVWPSKVSKSAASESWSGLSQQERSLAISSAASWFASWQKANPNAALIGASRFLSEKRWEDQRASKSSTYASKGERLTYWAKMINEGGFVSPSTLRPDFARELLAAKLVTPEKLRERGIAA